MADFHRLEKRTIFQHTAEKSASFLQNFLFCTLVRKFFREKSRIFQSFLQFLQKLRLLTDSRSVKFPGRKSGKGNLEPYYVRVERSDSSDLEVPAKRAKNDPFWPVNLQKLHGVTVGEKFKKGFLPRNLIRFWRGSAKNR